MSEAATKEKPNYQQTSDSGLVNQGNRKANLRLKTKGKNIKTILPVIYIPGIFASRIESEDGKTPIWDPDDSASMKDHFLKGIIKSALGIDVYWSDKELDTKSEHMNAPGKVMRNHNTESQYSVLSRIKQGKPFERLIERNQLNDWDENHWELIDNLAITEYSNREKRGWYEIINEYADLMEKIWLHQDDNFHYPTFGFGYNWRDTLHNSAEPLKARINEVLAQTKYPEFGEKDKDYLIDTNQKVIIVTHSMGSILARYASEVQGANNKIHSIIHINQPTTGAPILYRRFLTGTSAEKSFPFPSIISTAKSNAFNEVLGNNPYHFTRMAGQMAGAIQLLPTNEHICEETQNKHWLQITHPFIKKQIQDETQQNSNGQDYTTADIYDLYKSEAVGLLACKRYDKNGSFKPYTKEEFKRISYEDIFGDEQDELLSNINPKEIKDFENINEYYPDESLFTKDNYRLLNKKLKSKRSGKKGNVLIKSIKENIDKAKRFHTKLGLKKHVKTFVISSKGKKTVNQVIIDLNGKNEMECPLNESRSELGDGTVPLTSQDALLRDGNAIRAGDVITKKVSRVINKHGHSPRKVSLGSSDVAHAEMPSNMHAINQILEKITKVSSTLKPMKQHVSS